MKTVNAKGMACPKPVIEAKKALQEMERRELEVLVDNPIAVQNLEKLGNYLGLRTTSEKKADHDYAVCFYEKEENSEQREKLKEQGEQQPEDSCIPDVRKKGKVVVISADHMGEGDDILGRLLMKGFLYALTELEELPETILLYNGGAKLSIQGSDSLEDLKHLEAQGVEIMTCGTCLNHYQIADQLAVGRVTNMYEIAEKMVSASSLVKP